LSIIAITPLKKELSSAIQPNNQAVRSYLDPFTLTSNGFTGLLKEHNIKISMDGRGRALDNIFVERLWRSVKYECVYLKEWHTVRDATDGLRDYFNFYNHHRPHSGVAGKTPFSVHYNN